MAGNQGKEPWSWKRKEKKPKSKRIQGSSWNPEGKSIKTRPSFWESTWYSSFERAK